MQREKLIRSHLVVLKKNSYIISDADVKKGAFLGDGAVQWRSAFCTLSLHFALVLSGISVQIKRSMRFNPEQGPAQS